MATGISSFFKQPARPHVPIEQKGAERTYTVASSAAVTATGTTLLTITPNEPVWVYALSATANAGGTAVLGHRDAFTMNVLREDNTQLVTENTIATALFGPISDKLYLPRPWYVARGSSLKFNIVGVASGSFTPYVSMFAVRAIGGPRPIGGDRYPIYYAKNSGSVAASGTATVSTTFQDEVLIYGISAGLGYGASYVGTGAINGRDGFKFNVQRQNGDTLTVNQCLATSLLGITDKLYLLDNPWAVHSGETLDIPMTNLDSGDAGTFYYVYHCLARGAKGRV